MALLIKQERFTDQAVKDLTISNVFDWENCNCQWNSKTELLIKSQVLQYLTIIKHLDSQKIRNGFVNTANISHAYHTWFEETLSTAKEVFNKSFSSNR